MFDVSLDAGPNILSPSLIQYPDSVVTLRTFPQGTDTCDRYDFIGFYRALLINDTRTRERAIKYFKKQRNSLIARAGIRTNAQIHVLRVIMY